MSLVPLGVLLALGGGVLATARLARDIKRQREGFATTGGLTKSSKAAEGFVASPGAGHDDVITGGQEKYNPLTNLLDIHQNPFVGPNPGPQDIKSARQEIRGAFGGNQANPPSVGAPMNVRSQQNLPYKMPADTKGLRTYNVQKCEKVIAAKCSAFDDQEFAKNCGLCFKPGTDSEAQPRVGGLFLDADDKSAAELQSQALGERRVNYRPTVGTCPPGFFVVDKASCEALEKRLDCEQKKTFSIDGCSQCYTDGSYTIVDATVPRADLSLLVSYIGNLQVTLTGSTTPIVTRSSTALGDNTVPIGNIPEGSSIVITVSGSEGVTPVLGGYVQGPTVTGNFQVDIAQLADGDLESGGRPRMSGEIAVGGTSVIALRPGRNKTKMALRVQIPLTFVDVGEYEASRCTNGPYLTKESSAKTLSAGICFKPGNAPGAYSLACLQEKFIELGGTANGSGYPRDAAAAAALNKAPNGSPRTLGDIADLIYENSLKGQTGISSAGIKQTLPNWNEASVFSTGNEILNACDAAQITGTMTPECMSELWSNKGSGNRLGATYTGATRNSSLTGRNDRYCTTSGILAPYGPDGKQQDDAIKRAFNSGGTIQDIKDLYDRTHKMANDNSLKDSDRASAIKDCYGVVLNMPAAQGPQTPPTASELDALKQQYDALMTDINYLSGIGLGPASGNVTFDDRWAKLQELNKKILKPIKARYVRIKPSMKPAPDDRCIQISQLQVFNSAGQEIARGRPASASSVYSSMAGPSKAVDGRPSARDYPNMYHDACNTQGANQFWMVDLGSDQDLSYIIYYNRNSTNCCNHRADGMPVELLDSSMNLVGITAITGTGPKIQVNFTIFDKMKLPWNNLA